MKNGQPKIVQSTRVDVISVYPSGENRGPKTYFGKKWALCSYETKHAKGIIDIPIPKDCDNLHAVATDAVNKAISRGVHI